MLRVVSRRNTRTQGVACKRREQRGIPVLYRISTLAFARYCRQHQSGHEQHQHRHPVTAHKARRVLCFPLSLLVRMIFVRLFSGSRCDCDFSAHARFKTVYDSLLRRTSSSFPSRHPLCQSRTTKSQALIHYEYPRTGQSSRWWASS